MPKSLASITLVILIAAATYWLFKPHATPDPASEQPTPATTPATAPSSADSHPQIRETAPITAPTPSTPPIAATDTSATDDLIPPPEALNASDAVVLATVSQLNPEVAAWLLPEEQIRKWVALVNLLADGKVPVKDRPVEFPLAPFQVKQTGDNLWMERSNYRRARVLIKAMTQMPPSQVARYYAAWLPLLQKAQAELGNGKQFQERLQTALKRILAVRPLSGEIELKTGVLKYTFANPKLEQASALEKTLWRLGPTNTLRIQNYLRDLRPLL